MLLEDGHHVEVDLRILEELLIDDDDNDKSTKVGDMI